MNIIIAVNVVCFIFFLSHFSNINRDTLTIITDVISRDFYCWQKGHFRFSFVFRSFVTPLFTHKQETWMKEGNKLRCVSHYFYLNSNDFNIFNMLKMNSRRIESWSFLGSWSIFCRLSKTQKVSWFRLRWCFCTKNLSTNLFSFQIRKVVLVGDQILIKFGWCE